MNIFKVKFIIDTGYDYPEFTCIIKGTDRNNAIEKFFEWIEPQLLGECSVYDYTIIELRNTKETDILYHDFVNPIKRG